MIRLHKAFLTLAVAALTLPLTACETVDNAMHGIKQQIAAIRPAPRPEEQKVRTDAVQLPPGSLIAAAAPPAPEAPVTAADGVVVQTGAGCPKVSVVEDLDSLHQFTNPGRPSPDSRISSIRLRKLEAGCAYNENNLVIELGLTFEGILGPRARVWETDKPSFAYPYFVALTTPNGNIAAKEIFAATVSYDWSEDSALHHESMRQIIPRSDDIDESLYELLVGFQLSEGELAYNRSLRENPVVSAGISEQYIESATPQAKAEPAPLPAHKPAAPAPVVAEAPQPKPEPAPKTETVTITAEEEIIAVEDEPALTEIIVIEDEPALAAEPEIVPHETGSESAILEDEAILDAEAIRTRPLEETGQPPLDLTETE